MVTKFKDNGIYVLFDYINQDVVTKGTLQQIRCALIEMGEENEWDKALINEVYLLQDKDEFSKWVYTNMDCYLNQ